MASRFQASSLIAAPAYPNAIAWSQDNLLAIASSHIVTILNPAMPLGPRGLITIHSGEVFPIGVVDRDDLLSPKLIPTSLARDARPCVRSISWSPIGLAPNSWCLLAVCTTEGRVMLYRPPFCDFSAEWIEVVDISAKLCAYLESISFGELKNCSEKNSEEMVNKCKEESLKCFSRRGRKIRKVDLSNFVETEIESETSLLEENNSKQIVCVSKSKTNSLKRTLENSTLPLISADKYVARSSMLSSLVVAWSPVLQLSPKACSFPQNRSSLSLLAVGGKSGKVSLWRVPVPEKYSIVHDHVQTTSVLSGFLEAHNSWVTAICWALLDYEPSNPCLVLVTGSCDGSVKIWLADNERLMESGESSHTLFSLLKEVIAVDVVPVSVISVTVPADSSNKMLLAVGKGSGSFEVWVCWIPDGKLNKLGSYDAHDHVVTGLVWAFDGRCLYSCSQDNFVRNWVLREDVLSEEPIPSNTPRLKSSTELPDTYASCLGLAVSPGNLVIAMVRNFDEDLLDPMYQKRTQKAAVEFFWIGAQEVPDFSNNSSPFLVSVFPTKELVSWEFNILWSLKQFENQDKPLVVWDILAALLAFKHCTTEYVDHLLMKWLRASYIGSHTDLSSKKGLLNVSEILSEISSRKLHLLNIICRRVILSDLKADQINYKVQNLESLNFSDEKLTMWVELLSSSEKELRERLVSLSFSACIGLAPSGNWAPSGLPQMKRWVELNHDHVKDQLRVLAAKVQKHEKRLQAIEYEATEQCCYCSASVPFESPEAAFCKGIGKGHKLARCASSMTICTTTPTWFCMCCQRSVLRLAPDTLFTLSTYPSDLNSSTESLTLVSLKPLCPFCGILLRRLQPGFLLSGSLV